MSSSRLSVFCDRVLEAGWLLGVTITPVFFNVYSSRVFEPDKLTTLRALASLMAVAWLVRFLDERLRAEQPLRFTWSTPLVLPALLTMGIYLLSSAFSLVRYTSFLGSYQRLQGTFSLFGYLVIFFSILTSLRTREQLSRLLTVLILNSLPVSLYGIVQHNGLDPLPWAGDVQQRVASNMGNPIFVAAYLIMIVPLTASRLVESFHDILSRQESRVTDILRASGYIFLLAVQLLTIWYSQSRGPWLGVVTISFLFPFLALVMLLRQSVVQDGESGWRWADLGKGVAFGVVTLALAGGLALLSMLVLKGQIATYIGFGAAVLVFGGIWLYFVVERKGWRWLWIGWGTVGLTIALGLVMINVPGPLQRQVRAIKPLQRLTTITELQSGTGKVRGLIWQGTVELISTHRPIQFPDGRKDIFNPLRPLIGYGPESMYVAYNAFYPPELGRYESRTASPDRSHNETLDSLVITGVLGLGVYLFTFASVFCWGFHWLGLMRTRADLGTYVGLGASFAVLFFLIAWQLEGAYLFAVAIPLGLLVGTMVYVALQAFRLFARPAPPGQDQPIQPHAVLLIGILASVMAHFVEINFGIAIAATRTTFWALAGLAVVLGCKWVPGHAGVGGEIPAQVAEAGEKGKKASATLNRVRRRSSGHSHRAWLVPILTLSLVGVFLLGTLLFDFVNNPQRLTSMSAVFISSLTMKYNPTPTRAYGALMIFVFTWVMFGVVGLSEYDREEVFAGGQRPGSGTVIGLYGGLTLLGAGLFGLVIAGHQARLPSVQVATFEDVVRVAEMLGGLLGRYYGFLFAVLFVIAWMLSWDPRPLRVMSEVPTVLVGVVLLLVAAFVIKRGCYDLIMADIVFKQGGVFSNANTVNEKYIGISHYEKALEYAPREDYYMLFLGKAYLELAQGLPEETSRDERARVFAETERVLTTARTVNPLNTDHSANLARFYKSWAARVALDLRGEALSDADRATLDAQRRDLLARSLSNYQTALVLSPNNPIIWNELAQLYVVDLGDDLRFRETISRSLDVDPEFEQTWMLLGDIRSSQGDTDGAIEAYLRSLDIRNNCTVRRVIGTLWAQQGRWKQASDFLEDAVTQPVCLRSSELWELYRVLSIALANQERVSDALVAALQAFELAPEDQQGIVQALIDQLQAQSAPASPEDVSPTPEAGTP